MPHSPYRKTVYPPIQDLHEYRRELAQHRARWENDESDKFRDELLLDIGELLVEHCDFIETKLDIKKRGYGQLAEQNETLKQKNKALEEESQAQKLEITALKRELQKTGAAKGTEEQFNSNGDGTRIEINSQNLDSEVREVEKPEKGKDPLETAEMASSRKRGPEIDAAINSKALKKGRTVT